MLGGYKIIDLSGISVSMGSDVSISDLNVLKQLLTLRDHIEDNFDYSKPLNKRLKSVMIRLRDAESGEKTEGCLWGNLSIIDDNLSFNIDAIASVNPLKVLQINVVFEKKQDDDGNDYYDIKSAKYEFRGGEDVVTVTNIKNIPSAIINKLDCGDIVLKKDSSGLHAYIVSFRNATGICLTYTDASCIETQSYDKVGQNWVYNSEDKTPNLLDTATKEDIEGGTLENAKPIYFHGIDMYSAGTTSLQSHILNNSDAPLNTSAKVKAWFESIDGAVNMPVNGVYTDSSGTYLPFLLKKYANNTYSLYYSTENGYATKPFDWTLLEAVNDNVNKIN